MEQNDGFDLSSMVRGPAKSRGNGKLNVLSNTKQVKS